MEESCASWTRGLWVETQEPASIFYSKRLQHSLMLKLILFDTIYLAKTHWHGTFFNIRRFRLLFVTTVREDSCIACLRAACENCLPLTLWYFQVLSLKCHSNRFPEEPSFPDTSTGEIHNNVFRSLKKSSSLSFPVLHLLPQIQVFWYKCHTKLFASFIFLMWQAPLSPPTTTSISGSCFMTNST